MVTQWKFWAHCVTEGASTSAYTKVCDAALLTWKTLAYLFASTFSSTFQRSCRENCWTGFSTIISFHSANVGAISREVVQYHQTWCDVVKTASFDVTLTSNWTMAFVEPRMWRVKHLESCDSVIDVNVWFGQELDVNAVKHGEWFTLKWLGFRVWHNVTFPYWLPRESTQIYLSSTWKMSILGYLKRPISCMKRHLFWLLRSQT